MTYVILLFLLTLNFVGGFRSPAYSCVDGSSKFGSITGCPYGRDTINLRSPVNPYANKLSFLEG